MNFVVEVFQGGAWAEEAAARVALDLPGRGTVVLTGGTTARPVYGALAATDAGWGSIEVFFSDERCVPPEHEASNFGMANGTLLERVKPASVHRMKGEIDPEEAARSYGAEVENLKAPFDLVLLGMGADCHIAAMFPGGVAVDVVSDLCVAVQRPDGLAGLTLTPPAVVSARKVLLLVAGESKAAAVRRAVAGRQPARECPVRLLADHPDATFLLDDAAASLL
jgi:6-phosphogluconolactonase